MTCAFNEGHEVPNLDKVRLLLNLPILVHVLILPHTEEQLVSVVDDFFDVERLVMHHKWVARVVHDHVLCQIKELTNRLVILLTVLACQEQKVMVEKDHSHNLH